MRMTEMTQEEVLQMPFDINTHKQMFKHYLEVVIHPDGKVEYAVPSHQLKLFIAFYEKKYGEKISHTDVDFYDKKHMVEMKDVPREWWLDMIQFYTNETGCIAMWDHMKWCPKIGITRAQQNMVELLSMHGLYKGN